MAPSSLASARPHPPRASADHLRRQRLWQGLPRTTTSPDPTLNVGDPILVKVIELCGLYAGDFATASIRLRELIAVGAVTVRQLDGGGVQYIKSAEFPPPEDPSSWVDRANSELGRLQAQERAILTNERNAHEAAQRALNAPIAASNQRAMQALLQPMLSAWMDEHIGPAVEAAVERTMRANGLLETDAAMGSQIGSTHE